MLKNVILILLLATVSISNAQEKAHKAKENVYKKALRYGLFALAGYAEGMNNALLFHYSAFKRVHPEANDQFWNPGISWKNKYEDWDNGNQNPKFFQSTSTLVFTTDGFHLTNMVDHISLLAGASVTIPLGEKKPLKWYVKQIATSYLCNRAGFYLSYNIIYKQ